MIKINKTVISDTSDDGSSFFFHSTSLHNIGRPSEDKEEEAEEDVELENEDETEIFEEFPEADIPILDETINEVPEEENVNIDILA